MAPTLAPFPTTFAPEGMVCSVDHLASGAGVAMLRAGGTAVDAAVAASAVLAVTTQHMCGMGGDLFALVHSGGQGPPATLNASGRAGSGADLERLRADGHISAMPFTGDIRAVPVPGCVDGWVALHERFGRLPMAEVLAPAISYAEDGFSASPTLAASVSRIAHLAEAADYAGAGPGTRVRRPGVARAMRAIAADGRDGFYRGEFGEGLLAVGGGEFSEADLTAPAAEWVEPLRVEAWDRVLWTTPPNSQGYLTLAGAWIAAGLDVPADPVDPGWAHLLVEAARLAAFDRVDVLHEGADGTALVHEARLGPRRAAIDAHVAATGLRDSFRDGGTIYLCAVDGDRMGVSLIQSNASGWGALIAEPATRIFLQNRGIGFSVDPSHPAAYGPRRRPPHTLSPALVTTRDGALDAVIGTMGGDSQPQILLQLLARILWSGGSGGDAIGAGRWVLRNRAGGTGFDTWNAGGDVTVLLEGHAPTSWDSGLRERGHDVARAEAHGHGFGHAHLIRVVGDHLEGAADPRARAGAAAGL